MYETHFAILGEFSAGVEHWGKNGEQEEGRSSKRSLNYSSWREEIFFTIFFATNESFTRL